LAAGVYDDFGGDGFIAAIFMRDAHTDGAITFKNDFANADAFFSDDAMFAGILEHHLVEFAAEDLPGFASIRGGCDR